MQRYYRIDPADRDPDRLLDPEYQESEPWSGTVYGRCDKCGGTGRTQFECESCRGEADQSCPVCHGQVTYESECPACKGSGQIDDSTRQGVSVFPTEEGLYRYMVRRDADLSNARLVVLEGEESEDEDVDADEGAVLIRPSRVVETREIDPDGLDAARRDIAEAA